MTEPGFNKSDGVSLKEYLDAKIDALEKSLCQKITTVENHNKLEHAMNQTAINKAEEAVNMRLASMNEFRSQLHDQAATFISHPLYDQQMSAIESRIKVLADSLGALIENLDKSLDSRIKDLEIDRATLAGKASQSSMMIALVGSLLGIALSVISLIAKFK